jgi:hypothetical protein
MLQPIAGPTPKSEHVTCCAWEAVPMSTRHLLCMRSCAHVVRQHPPPSHPTHVFHTQDIHPWLQPILGNSRGKVRTFSCRARYRWNDADQLTVGDHHAQGWCHNSSDPLGGCNGLSPVESATMMSFWAMFASPCANKSLRLTHACMYVPSEF